MFSCHVQSMFFKYLSLVTLTVLASLGFSKFPQASELAIDSAGIALGGKATGFNLGSAYYKELYPWLQAGGGLNYQSLKDDDQKASHFRLKAGIQFNMDGAIPNAFFLELGLARRDKIGGYLQFGKRIDMGRGISFRPNLEVISAGGTMLAFNILSVSWFF